MVKDSIRSSTPKNVGRSGGVSSGLAGDLGDQTSSAMDFGRGLPYARERDRAGIPGLVNPWDPITRVPRGIKPEDHGRWKREDDEQRIDEEYRRRDVKKEATVKEPPNRDEPKGGKKPKGGSSGGGGSGRSFGGPNSGDKIDDDKGRRPDDSSGEWLEELERALEFREYSWDCRLFMVYMHYPDGTWDMGTSNPVTYNHSFDLVTPDEFPSRRNLEYIVNRNGNITEGTTRLFPRSWWSEYTISIYESEGGEHICSFNKFVLSQVGARRGQIYGIQAMGNNIKSFVGIVKNLRNRTVYYEQRYSGNWSNPIRRTGPARFASDVIQSYGRSWAATHYLHGYPLGYRYIFKNLGIHPISIDTSTSSDRYIYRNPTETCNWEEIIPRKIRRIWIPDMNEECCGMIRRIYEFLDPESFPAEMPEKITVNAENTENRIKRINTLPEWLMYRFDIDDERWGEFEVKVEIDDVN
ncbi:MAG: hypothetical protein P5681_22485, partial [Limnospira sp. PMC 894.15]